MKALRFLFLLFLPWQAFSQINLNTFGTPYIETFGTSSVGGWTNNSTFPGWYLQAGGTFTFIAPTINITTGAPSNTGGFYTYMCNGNNDIKLGGRPSNASGGGSGSGVSYMGMRLKNNTGSTITSLSINFDAYQLSLAQNSCNVNTLDFSYQTGTTMTALTGGVWTPVSALQYVAPNNDCPGSGSSNQLLGYPCTVSSNLSACITVSIPSGSEIMLRWGDLNNAANDPHLAIDNIAVTPFRPVSIAAGSATTFCQGDSVTLTASGGSAYSWNTGASTAAINVSTNGTYTVTSTNVCQTTTATQAVTVNPLPTPAITAGSSTTFCQGDSVKLSATGGTGYAWNTGASTNAISVSTGGTYTVTVSNSCGSATATQAVTVNPLPTPAITAGSATTFCQGGSVTLTASGGTAYAWSTGDTTHAINAATSGTYTVTVSNSCGSATATQAVTVNPLPTAAITAGSATTFCQGSSVTLTASGGTAYAWNTGDTTHAINAATSGTYTVTVSNSCGSATATQAVTVNPLPTAAITAGSATIFCQGGSVALSASGGTAYAWSTGDTTHLITVSTNGTYTLTASNSCGSATATQAVTVNPLPSATAYSNTTTVCGGSPLLLWATGTGTFSWSDGTTNDSTTVTTGGTYTVTATNACGSTTDAITITTSPLPAPVIALSGSATICPGDSVTLTVSGGTAYVWNTGAVTPAITVHTAGTYTVTATNSCGSATATTTISTSTSATATAHAAATSVCPGSSVILWATGTGGYSWSNGAHTDSITVTTGGTYVVTSGSSCGIAKDSVSITQLALPTAAITSSGSTTICTGGSVTLNASGGTSYVWAPLGATTSSVNATTAGTYTVVATNTCGSATATATVTVNSAPVATVTATGPTTICAGSSVTLNAGGGGSYVWSTGASTNSINATTSGTYTVTATNSCGSSTATISVTTDNVTASFTSDVNSGLHPLPVNFTNTSSSNAVTYLWNFGDGNTSLAYSPSNTFHDPGTYNVSLTVANGNGCTDTDVMQVVVLDDPSTLVIPNVFTPNGDGKNDVFLVKATGIHEFECTIFDRWGMQVASFSTVTEGWDGKTTSGAEASDGTYYYIIKATGSDNKTYEKNGYITLVK